MTEQNININIERDGSHGWKVLATLLACGAVGMTAWAISNAGALDLAATGLTMFLAQLISMMMKVGLIVLPEKKTGNFTETSGFLKTAMHEFQVWQANSPIWRLAAMAMGYTVVFMIARWGLSIVLSVFSNVWIAGAASALVAALIVAPNLFSSMFKSMSKSGVQLRTQVAEEADQAATKNGDVA